MEYYEDSFASRQAEHKDFCVITNYIITPEKGERYYYDTREDAEDELAELKKMFPRENFQIKEITRTVSV